MSFTALMTPESLPSHFQTIGRYSPPFAYHTPTLRPPFPLPLERETYAKGTRNVRETPKLYTKCMGEFYF